MKTFFLVFFSFFFTLPNQGQSLPSDSTKSIGITFSFPWLNFYNYFDYKQNENKNKSGFFGLGIAAYYQKDKNKISLNCGTTEDLSSPIGIIDYSAEGTKTSIGSKYAELVYHRPIYHSFGGIFGLNFTNYKYQYIDYSANLPAFKKSVNTLGGTFGLEYLFNKTITVAAFYRPILGSFEAEDYYRHLISIDVRLNLELKKRKNRKLR